MIEVLDIEARHLKGTGKDGRNYDFYIQKCVVESVDRDGIDTREVVEVQTQPGEVLTAGDDYVIHPASVYVRNFPDKEGRERKRLAIAGSPKLVRFADLARELGYVKAQPAAKAA